MSTLRKAGRERQLSWLLPGSVLRQDQDLIDFVCNNDFKQCMASGDVEFLRPWIQFVDKGPVALGIVIQQAPFDLDDLVDRCNDLLENQIMARGQLYLAFNRYQIKPKRYAEGLPCDFDQAIERYVTDRIRGQIERYLACGDDGGNKFNWVHPLTRFYISNKK